MSSGVPGDRSQSKVEALGNLTEGKAAVAEPDYLIAIEDPFRPMRRWVRPDLL